MNRINILLGIVALLLVGLIVWYATQLSTRVAEDDSTRAENAEVLEEVEIAVAPALEGLYEDEAAAFVTGDNLLRRGQYAAARSFYEDALNAATSPAEEAHIKYKIALTYTVGEPAKSIELLKEIVATETYPDIQKQYAVQRLSLFDGIIMVDPTISALVYEGEPYSEFGASEDSDLRRRLISEYALTFGGAPLSHLLVANWYAVNVPNQPADAEQDYVDVASFHISEARAYGEANAAIRNNRDLLPRIAQFEANVVGELAVHAGPDNVFIDQYQTVFDEAYAATEDLPGLYGVLTYRLVQTAVDIGREEDIAHAEPYLDTFITEIEEYQGMKNFFAQNRDGAWGPERRAGLVRIAEAYPQFADLLVSLGWSEAEFGG